MKLWWIVLSLMLIVSSYQFRQNRILQEKIQKLVSIQRTFSKASLVRQVTGIKKKSHLPKNRVVLEQQCRKWFPTLKAIQTPQNKMAVKAQEGLAWQEDLDDGERGDGMIDQQAQKWHKRIRQYLVDDLNLSEEDYFFYLGMSKNMQSLRESLGDIIEISDDKKEGFLRVRENLISELQDRLGLEKFESMHDYEQQVKEEIVDEDGFYGDYGFF